jgi:hypothetical protein
MEPESDESTKLVQSVLQDVSDSFSKWERAYSAAKLASLSATRETDLEIPPSPVSSSASGTFSSGRTETPLDPVETDNITFYDLDEDSIVEVAPEVVEIPQEFQITPTPAYESCLATTRNKFKGDDPPEMEFMPFSDDPTFETKEYSEDHYGNLFAWQTHHNPDCERFTRLGLFWF